MSSKIKGRVLTIAGSDSSGGAGVQADIKAITALGGYALTALTAVTAQDSEGVAEILSLDPEMVATQIHLALNDIGVDCIKTGMLYNAEIIDAVCHALDESPDIPLVVDPVMVSTSGDPLLDDKGIEKLEHSLLCRATLLTPNREEAENLSGVPIREIKDMRRAASLLLGYGAQGVLIKGGHMGGEVVNDLLCLPDGQEELFTSLRVNTRHTHGTGCTLSAAIATGLAQGLSLRVAVRRARHYVRRAIETAPGFGKGQGPLNHVHNIAPFDE